MTRWPLADTLVRDVRYSVRVLLRTPVFTATAVATLALAIGANAAVFSLADALLWRQLPYPEPDRLAMLVHREESPDGVFVEPSADGAMWEAVRDHVPSLDVAVQGGGGRGANLVVDGSPAYVTRARVSAGFSRVLGVPPARGRWFSPDEDRPGGPAVVALRHAGWQRYFHGVDDILGRSILLAGEPHAVIGVMPAGFVSTSDADMWAPLRPSTSGEGSGTNYEVIARLKPGATWAQAEGELHAAGADAFGLLGRPAGVTRELGITPLGAAFADRARDPIVLLASAVAAVLLIACVNLAALMLTRGASRSREIATRMALGGGRSTVVRQLMVESIVIAVAGGLAGMLVASVGLGGLQALGGDRFEEWTRASIDGRVVLVALALSAVTSVAFGLAPALQASRLDVSRALADGGSRGVADRSSTWPRRLLVVVEVALGVVLLVATGLLVRTFVNVRGLDPGFDTAGVVTATASLQDARYQDAASVNRLFDESLRRLAATPGVGAAAVSLELPYERLLNSGFHFADDEAERRRTTNASYVTPGFLTTLGLPLRAGRDFSDADRVNSPPVALVNETFERIYSTDRPVVGRRLQIGGLLREVVGVTGDVQARPSFSVAGVASGPLVSLPLVLMPASQTTDAYFRLVHTWFAPVWTVRSRDAGAAAAALRRAIGDTDPLLPISSVRDMEDVMSAATTEQRLMMTLVAILAGAAVLLAAIGVHGVIAQSVASRRREFGIRLALGATPAGAVRAVSAGGILLGATGALAGGLLSIPATTLVRSFLWRVEVTDPWTYAGVAVLMLVVASVASVIPALALLRLNPAETLRT